MPVIRADPCVGIRFVRNGRGGIRNPFVRDRPLHRASATSEGMGGGSWGAYIAFSNRRSPELRLAVSDRGSGSSGSEARVVLERGSQELEGEGCLQATLSSVRQLNITSGLNPDVSLDRR